MLVECAAKVLKMVVGEYTGDEPVFFYVFILLDIVIWI